MVHNAGRWCITQVSGAQHSPVPLRVCLRRIRSSQSRVFFQKVSGWRARFLLSGKMGKTAPEEIVPFSPNCPKENGSLPPNWYQIGIKINTLSFKWGALP